MSWPLVQIGKYADKVRTWNPAAGEECIFQYVDLSSVDKSRKVIDLDNVAEISSAEAPSRARQLVVAGDVLVATVRPNLNGVAVVPAELNGATASTGYCVLRADEKNLHGRYLFHWVQTGSFVEDMMSKATGANYPAVSDKIVKESKIPLPPLPEQKRIAAILDKADAIRRKRQQALQLADDILHSVFQCHSCAPLSLKPLEGSVDHRWVRLSTVARLESGHTPSRKIEEYWGGDIKWLSLKDVKSISDAYIYDTFDKPTQLGIDNSSARLLPKGTVALCRTASVGRCVILGEDMATSQDYVNWVCGKELIPEFLYATLLVSDKFFDGLKQGSTHKTIYVPVVKEFHIKLPSLGVQEKIALALKSIVEFKLKALNEAGDLDYLFASLSQKAFAGQL